MTDRTTFSIEVPIDLGPLRYLAASARALAAEREAELERFAISGAMPRDLCIVVSPFVAVQPGAPIGAAVLQPWRVN